MDLDKLPSHLTWLKSFLQVYEDGDRTCVAMTIDGKPDGATEIFPNFDLPLNKREAGYILDIFVAPTELTLALKMDLDFADIATVFPKDVGERGVAIRRPPMDPPKGQVLICLNEIDEEGNYINKIILKSAGI